MEKIKNINEIKKKSDKYLMNSFKRQEICFLYGSGEILYDTEGKSYIDFVSGNTANTLGHANADWIASLREQADRLILTSTIITMNSKRI